MEDLKAQVYADAVRDSMILLLSLPMKVLSEYYWKKASPAKIQRFVDRVIDAYEKWQDDEEGWTTEELKRYLWEEMGVRFEPKND